MELLLNFWYIKIKISNSVSDKQILYDYDYLGRFLLQFHTAIYLYRLTLSIS